jgi:putative transposase
MKFGFIAKHRSIWPVAWLCEAMGVSRSGFHAWLNRSPSARSRSDETVGQQVKASFLACDRTYGARRVWRDLLADGVECGLHRMERLMRLRALRARPRRRRLPKDEGDRPVVNVPLNLLDRQFEAEPPNQKWIADFTYIWTAEGWLYVSAVIDLFSRRVVGWSMSASMTAQLVADVRPDFRSVKMGFVERNGPPGSMIQRLAGRFSHPPAWCPARFPNLSQRNLR